MKTSRKGMLMAALICGTVAPVLFSGSAYAAEKEDVDAALKAFTLDPMVVTSQRRETKDLDTPASVIVVSEQKIQDAGYKNVFDAIDHQVGISSTGYGDAGTAYGMSQGRTIIRGFDRGTLILVDGIPMNLKNYNGIDSIPIDMVKKIEIIKGAAGTLYGAEAMGGVVNIITKRPEGKPQFKIRGTVGNYHKDYGLTYSDSKFIASFQREYSNKRNHSNDFPDGSDTDWWVGKGVRNRAAVAANITDELSANFMFTDTDVTRGGQKYHKSSGRPYSYRYQDRRITTGLHYEGKTNGIKATFGYNYYQTDGRDFYKSRKVGKETVYDYFAHGTPITSSAADMTSYFFDVQKKFDFGRNNLVAGYSFKRENYKSIYDNAKVGHRTNNALYLSYTHNFGKKFSTTLGLRGEHINDPYEDQNVFNPQIQTLYKFDDSTSWFINIGRAFQMPTVDAYFSQKKADGPLDPEKGWTYETGIKKLIGDNQSVKFSVYHMDIKNKIAWTPKEWDPDGIQRAYNSGDFKNTGVEIEYARKFDDHWDLSASFGYSNPQIYGVSVDKTKPNVYVREKNRKSGPQGLARLDGSLNLTYRNEKLTSTLSYKYLGDREDYKVSNPDYNLRQIPNKSRLTWNTNYRFTKNDTISLTLNNIFDRKNYSNPYGNLELPFNWRLTYTRTF